MIKTREKLIGRGTSRFDQLSEGVVHIWSILGGGGVTQICQILRGVQILWWTKTPNHPALPVVISEQSLWLTLHKSFESRRKPCMHLIPHISGSVPVFFGNCTLFLTVSQGSSGQWRLGTVQKTLLGGGGGGVFGLRQQNLIQSKDWQNLVNPLWG